MAILDFSAFGGKRKKEKERFLRKRETKEEKVKSEVFVIEKKSEKDAGQKIKETPVFEEGHRIFKSPHFTEKSAGLNERGVYVFKIKPEANKIEIKKAIVKIYGVKAEKVNIIKVPAKEKFIRGKWGKKPGYKKAVVYLKKGEKIEI